MTGVPAESRARTGERSEREGRRSRGARLRSRAPVVGGLVAVWVFCWGDLSVANVLSGLVVAVVVLALFPVPMHVGTSGLTLRPLPALRLLVFFLVELVQSNISMARDLLGRRDRMRTGILAYRPRVQSDTLLTFLANVTALTPGAMPVEVDHEPRTLYVHVTRMHERHVTERNLARYEEMFLAAFGSPEQLAELAAAGPPGGRG